MGCSSQKLNSREDCETSEPIIKKGSVPESSPTLRRVIVFVRGPPGLKTITEAPNYLESSPFPLNSNPTSADNDFSSAIENNVN